MHAEASGEEGQPDEESRDHSPGKYGTESGPEHPGNGRIKDKARLAEAVVCLRGPARIEIAFMPGARGFHPGGEVESEIVAGGVAEEKHGRDDGERGEGEKRVDEQKISACGTQGNVWEIKVGRFAGGGVHRI